MKKLFTCIVLSMIFSGTTNLLAQKVQKRAVSQGQIQAGTPTSSEMWALVSPAQAPDKSLLRMAPTSYLVYKLNVALLKTQLWGLLSDPSNTVTIQLPIADGTFRSFKVWESSMMPQELAAQYPGIKTFTGEAINDARVTVKLDFTELGFHGAIFDGNQISFADPYDNLNDGFYVVHFKKDENRPFAAGMRCEVKGNSEISPAGEQMQLMQSLVPATNLKKMRFPTGNANSQDLYGKTTTETGEMAALTASGSNFATYRLALSANAVYCQAATALATPTIGQCLSAMTTTMNRVNGVYNRELAVQLNFVAAENSIIWPTVTGSINGPDPFDAINSSATSCISQNQTTCDTRIGSANYDIGHVFTTGAGGLASVGIVCNNSFKAQGVTGSGAPFGDNFDIDYVCHEMGHQFGSSHTFNNNADGACGGNADITHAYEPGSGGTIMDYAGICSPDNVQAHSDPYFSASSLEQIQVRLVGSEATCAVNSSTGHVPVTIASFTASYKIPYKTPFELSCPSASGSVSDTAITYGWFQYNLGDFGERLNNTFVRGPIFRSYQPVYDTNRVFPRVSTVLAGLLSNAGEKAPDTARFLTFKTVIRNIAGGNGCFKIPDDSVHIDVNSTGSVNGFAGFKVTSQNTTGIVYTGGTAQTITWNRVGTDGAPVNATNVNIYMSTDGGFTWPFFAGTYPNIGTALISVPNPTVSSSTCRFKVKGAGNIFFNVNSTNFTVNPGSTTAPITGTFTVCVTGTTTLSDATPGGVWTSSTPAVATVGAATGIVTGISTGTTIITYTAISGPVTAIITVNTVPAPGAISGSSGVCTGATTTLTNGTPGGVWSSSDVSKATVSGAGVVSGVSAGTLNITYTVTNGCGTGFATKAMTVSAPIAVAPITGTMSVCQGSTTTLSDATAAGVWSSTNTSVATITSGGVVSGVATGTSTISYAVTNAFGCVSAATAVVTVNSVPTATTSPSGSVVICTGGSVVISASPTTTGLSFQWQDGGVDIAGATNATYTATTGGNFRVVITTPATCSGTSAVVTVTVSGGTVVVPSVSMVATPGTNICSAVGAVTYTATPVNGGPTPTYQWFVNGTLAGGAGAVYAYTPANGDIVKCQLTSSLPCASPSTAVDSVTMTVNPTVTPDVTVSPSPNDTVCIGQSVTYTAVTIGGGTAPTYLWTVNGISVATGPTYSTIPANGDVVVCQLTSNAVCRTTTVATSAPLVMTVQAPLSNTVAISASATSIVAGESITFVAIALNAGPSATYQWYVNGVAVTGATLATFTTATLANGQIVQCRVSTTEPCVSPSSVLSGGIAIDVTTGLWETTRSGSSFTLSPNPNSGSFVITGRLNTLTGTEVRISVTNILGQVVYNRTTLVTNGRMNEQVSLASGLPTGTYLVGVTSGTERVVFVMVTNK